MQYSHLKMPKKSHRVDKFLMLFESRKYIFLLFHIYQGEKMKDMIFGLSYSKPYQVTDKGRCQKTKKKQKKDLITLTNF